MKCATSIVDRSGEEVGSAVVGLVVLSAVCWLLRSVTDISWGQLERRQRRRRRRRGLGSMDRGKSEEAKVSDH